VVLPPRLKQPPTTAKATEAAARNKHEPRLFRGGGILTTAASIVEAELQSSSNQIMRPGMGTADGA
jgi:hypothetical protein